MTSSSRSRAIPFLVRTVSFLAAILLITSCRADQTDLLNAPPASSTGTLALMIDSLPTGAAPTITVTNSQGFRQDVSAPGNLSALPTGAYTIVAAPVTVNDQVYAPVPATQVVQLASTLSTTPVAITYLALTGPAVGTLTVAVSGLPSGVNASVTISGPSGLMHTIGGSATFPSFIPGNYVVGAADVITGGKTYRAQSSSQAVALTAGATATVVVSYSEVVIAPPPPPPATGSLVISLTGLPGSGGGGNVSITGPGGFSQQLAGTQTQTLNGLAAGSYTIVAVSVTHVGILYNPSVASQTATVSGSVTTNVTVAYSTAATPPPSTGSAVITIVGLPIGANANVTVTGPAGYTQSLTGTQTLSGLAPGTYTVAAAVAMVGGFGYAPSSSTQNLTVAANAVATAGVTYAAADGDLTITIAGLPAGGTGGVTVSGPGGFSQTVTATQTLTALAPGSYTIAAQGVWSSGFTYTPTPASQLRTVAAGGGASVAVTYAVSTATLNIAIGGVPSGANGNVVVSGPGGFSQTLTSSQLLSGLAVGSYAVAPSNITVGSSTYTGSPSTQVVALVAGSAATASVAYAIVPPAPPATGSLTVSLSGLPGNGGGGNITLNGPGGFSQLLAGTQTQTLNGLVAGSYSVVAVSVTHVAIAYYPAAATQAVTVNGGATANVTVAYSPAAPPAPTTGSATVTISGLPVGANANVTVTGPAGFTQALTATQTLAGLAPGAYSIVASTISAGGFGYAPASASQSVTVVAGATATGSVTYAPADGDLNTTINGLPVGSNASVTVTGPGGYTRVLAASQLLTALVTGSYTVSAANVTVAGVSYAPSASTQTASVTAGTTVLATVTYTAALPTTGSLAVTVAGLPGGVNGSVTVTGPGSFSQLVTATQTLTGRAAGVYTITAATVVGGGTTYTPSPATQTVSILAGQTASGTVTYASSGLVALSPGFHVRTLTIPAAQAGGTAQTFNYQIYVPTGYTTSTTWPVILTSSGSGEFGTNNTSQLGVGLGPHLGALGERAIVVFPQWRSGLGTAGLRPLMETTALRNTMAEVRADSTRIYMTGNSSGGFQVWEALYRYPTLFAAGISAAGGVSNTAVGAPSVNAEIDALLPMPMWIFSADDDGTVPTATYFTPIVNEWIARGADAATHQYTLYRGIGGHAPTWDTAFADPATWAWLFAQHR